MKIESDWAHNKSIQELYKLCITNLGGDSKQTGTEYDFYEAINLGEHPHHLQSHNENAKQLFLGYSLLLYLK